MVLLRQVSRGLSSLPAASAGLEVRTLQNGVSLAAQAFGGNLASVAVSVSAGSRYETATTSGLSALIQKAALADIQVSLGSLGGVASASTTREQTTYVATVLKEHAAIAATALAKAVSSPPSSGAFEAAKAATLASFSSVPTDLIEEVHSCAYLDTQMGSPVSGTEASVSALTQGDVAAAFTAPSIVKAAVVGGEAADVAPAFAELPPADALAEVVPAVFTGSDKKITYDPLGQAKICFAYEFPTLTSPRAVAAKILPFLLAQPPQDPSSSYEAFNSHAKLARDFAEQDIAFAVEPFYRPYADTALFGLNISCDDIRCEDAMWYATTNLVRLCYDVTQSELDRAKLTFKATLAKTIASPDNLAKAYVDDLAQLGRVVPPPELAARISDLPLMAVKDLCYDHIHDCDHALVGVGTIHELPDYNWVRTASYNYHY